MMEEARCTHCGKTLHQGDWVSKSGYCHDCAERILKQSEPVIFNKHWLAILLMCIFGGVLGIHRFAVGKFGSGVLYLFTTGLLGIGVIVDIILLATGTFTDEHGHPIKAHIPNEDYLPIDNGRPSTPAEQ